MTLSSKKKLNYKPCYFFPFCYFSATTAIVEFGSVRDVENYIRRDKTLMIENKFLGIEGCSVKSGEPSNEGRSLIITQY